MNKFNIAQLDLNLLVVLDAIYTEGGITRASETLHLTQPAVSHALARLREVLNDPLFIREGQTMVPTPLTHQLITPIRQSLRGIESALNALHAFDPLQSERQFTLGLGHIVESAVLPELVQRAASRAPRVRIAAVHYTRQDFPGDLMKGNLDAVLDILIPPAQNIRHQKLMAGNLVVVVRRDHPTVQGRIDLDTYLNHDHVMASSRPTGPGLEDVELNRLGYRRRIKVRCQYFWTAYRLVSVSDLLLTMPEKFAARLSTGMDHQILPFPIDIPPQDLHLYWHESLDNDPANRWLREQIHACFQ